MPPRSLLCVLFLSLALAVVHADDALLVWLTARTGGVLSVAWVVPPLWIETNAVTSFNVTLNGTLVANVPATTTNYDVCGLTNNTAYAVVIAATTGDGAAPLLPSNELVVSTLNVTNPMAPPMPQLLDVGGGFVRVRVALPLDTGGVNITSVSVIVRSQTDYSSTSFSQTVDEPDFVVYGLLEKTTYRVRAYVINSAGLPSGQSAPLFADTLAAQLPSACPPPTVLSVTGGSIRLQLNPPMDDGGARIRGYIVYMAVNGSSTFQELANTVASIQPNIIDIRRLPGSTSQPLLPLTRYDIKAVAVNMVDVCINPTGLANFTTDAVSVVTTAASLPDSPPAPYFLSATGGLVTIQLLMPANMHGAVLSGFAVMVDGVVYGSLTSSEERPFAIGYLRSSTSYSVQVAVNTAIGTSGWSEPLVVSTTSPSRPSSPLNISVSDTTSSQAQVQWLSPVDSGGLEIAEYRLMLFSTVGLATISVPGNITSYRLTTLLAATTYTVKITAVNDIFLESSSSRTQGVTLETMPPTSPTAPSGVHALSSTGGSIEVAWQAPTETGGSGFDGLLYNVSMFRVAPCLSGNASNGSLCAACDLVRSPSSDEQYILDKNCVQPSTPSCPDSSTSCCVSTSSSPVGQGQLCSRIGGLDRYRLVVGGPTVTSFDCLNHSTTYFVGVQAINKIGQSKFSPIVGIHTSSQTAPGYPSSIRQLAGTGGSVLLAWNPPHDTGGAPIVGYHVYRDYRLLTSEPIYPPYSDCGSGLLASTQYLYNIAAVNASRLEGSLGSVLVMTPPVSPPLQIASLSLQMRTISWLNITVAANCDRGGSSAVSYQFMVAQNGISITSGFFPCCSFVVNSLQAGQEYQVSVRVANEAATLEWVNGTFATSRGIPANTTMVLQRANSYSLMLAASVGNNSDWEVVAYEIAAYQNDTLVQGYTFPCDTIIGPGLRACPDTFRIDGLSPKTTYQVSSRALGPNGASDWSAQVFTTTNESSGVVEFVSQSYAATSGSSVNLNVRRANGAAGVMSVVVNVSQPDTVVAQCDCFLGQGCTCGLQTASSGAKSRAGTLTFIDGQDAQTVRTFTWEDIPNFTQTLSVVMTLTASGGAVGPQSQAVLQVSPSQRTGFPAFARSQVDVLENTSYAKINIARLNGSSGGLTFDVESFDISSIAAHHYIPLSQTIVMSDRQTSTSVWVRVINNRYYEGTRVFGFRLRERPANASTSTSQPKSLNTCRVRIADDEDPSMQLPPTPTSLDASRVTGGEIELVWQAANSTAATTGYMIQVSTPSNQTNAFSLYNTSAVTTFTLSSLQPSTLYRFQVAGWNPYGMSELSATMLVVTTEPSPPTAPRSFRTGVVGGSFVGLVWDVPRDLGGESLVGYQLSILGDDGALRLLAEVPQPLTAYKVEGLTASTAYTFSVTAFSASFPGPNPAASITLSTGTATAPAKPPPPTLMRQPTGGTLTFLINEPRDIGGTYITDYSLFLRKVVQVDAVQANITNTSTSSTEEPFQVVCTEATPWANDSSSRSCTVYKLLAGMSYEAYVVLYNAVSSSEASDRVVYRTSSTVELPSPPDNFRASRVTAGNIYLEWDLPLDLGGTADVIGYTVFQRSDPYYAASYFIVYDGQDSTERHFALKGLSRGTVYAFAVIAQNAVSYCVNLAAQHMTDFMQVRTLDTSQLSAPQSLVRVSATGGSITIGWQPPDDLAGVPLSGYIVELMSENGTESQQITPDMLNVNPTQFTHFGLTEQTTYRYAVIAINQDGQGEPSAIATFSTEACSPPMGVVNGQLVDATGGRITISWSEPQDTGGRPIVYYQVTRTDQQNRVDTVSTASFTDTNGLVAQSQYLYYVRAFNGLYLGQVGYIWASTGAPSVSNAPLPTATVPYGGRIEVAWTSAQDTGGVPIRAYEVTLFVSDGTTPVSSFNGMDTNFTFTSLTANTIYLLDLAAINDVGKGPVVQYQVSTGDVDLPSAPPPPTATNILGGSMWLALYPPSYTGGENVSLLLMNGTRLLGTFTQDQVSTFVSGLVALTQYSFRVIAANSRGRTAGDELVISTAAISKPSAVASIQLVEASFDRLSISWPAVDDNGGDVSIQYEVSYFACDASGTALSSSTTATVLTYLTTQSLTSLSHTTNYSIAVRALTSTGIYGDSSPTVIFVTEEPLMGRIIVQSSDVFIREGNPVVSIPLTRVVGSFGDTTYTYQLIDETALAGVNYDALGSDGIMASGVKTGVIDVSLRNDAVYNPNITFIVEVHDGPSSSVTTTRVTILDDGDAGFISFSAAEFRVLENAGVAYLPITRNGGNSPTAIIEPFIVTAQVALQTRFTLVEQTIIFDDGGATIQDLTVQIEDDSVFQYWPDSVVISFRILEGGVWVGDIPSANLTAIDDGDVSPPKEITSLRVGSTSGGSAQLSWFAPTDRGGMDVDLSYFVQILSNGNSVQNETVMVATSTVIYNLIASTTYQVIVSAGNMAGPGAPSSPLLLSTPKPTPPTAPLGIALIAASSSNLMVSWSPPQDAGGSPVVGYTIYNVLSSGLVPFPSVTCSLPNMCSIKGLMALTPYNIQVRANSAVVTGTGELSPVTVFQTSNPDVPDPPPLANVTLVSAGAMTINMFSPLNVGGSEVQQYRLFMRSPANDYFNVVYQGAGSSFTVYRLDRRTVYEIKYQAINSVGASDYSPVLTYQTLERSLVSEPLGLIVVYATGGAITLQWIEPLDVGGRPVTGYTVMIKSPSTNSSVVAYDGRGSPVTQGVVYGLTANTTYTMFVIAYTEVSNCFSPTSWASSVPIQASTTLPTLPTPAPVVVLVRVTGGIVELTWSPPLDAGGVPIAGYIVSLVSPTGTTPIFTSLGTGPFSFVHNDLIESTVYTYLVKANSSVGDSPYSDPLIVKTLIATAPSAPLIVRQLSYVTGGAIQIGWDRPVDTGGQPLQSYWVYRDGAPVAQDLDASARSFIDKQNLRATSSYVYTIRAVSWSTMGSEQSAPLVAKTAAASKPQLPMILSSSTGASFLSIVWAADLDTGGLPISLFEAKLMQGTVTIASYVGVDTSFRFTRLVSDTTYRFVLTSYNQLGASSSLSATFTTLPAVSPDAPLAPVAVVIFGGNITVEVTSPVDTGGANVTDMRLYEATLGYLGSVPLTNGSLKAQFTVFGLVKTTSYVITTSAISRLGEGAQSPPLAVRTGPLSPPGAIRIAPNVTGATGTTMSIVWTAPVDTGGDPSLSYEVRYVDPSGVATSSVSVARTFTGTLLKYFTMYTVGVRATNAAGKGGWSPIVGARTLPDAAGEFNLETPSVSVLENAGKVVLNVLRSNGLSSGVTVSYTILLPTANAPTVGKDFALAEGSTTLTGSVIFASLQVNATITILILNDAIYEFPDEQFEVQLTSAKLVQSAIVQAPKIGVNSSTAVTILDDGDAGYISFTQSNYSVREDAVSYDIPIIREFGKSTKIVLGVVFLDGTAKGDRHYRRPIIPTLTMEDGQTTAVVRVSIINDKIYQFPDEFFTIVLVSLDGGARMKRNVTTVTILDDGDQSAPATPPPPTPLSSTGGAVTFALRLPLHNGSALGVLGSYIVRIANPSTGELLFNVSVPVSSKATVGRLIARTTFMASVAATGTSGVSPFSLITVFSTIAPTLPGPVVNVSVNGSTGGSVQLAWSPPDDTGGVPITKYRIYKITQTAPELVAEFLQADLRGIVYGLTANTNYRFAIQAGNAVLVPEIANGWGALGIYVNVVTPAPSLPGPTRDVQNGPIPATGGAVSIAWTPPLDTGGTQIRRYEIYARNISTAFSVAAVTTEPTSTLTVVERLYASSWYEMFVLAVSDLPSLSLPGVVTCVPGSKVLITTQDLSKRVATGSVLRVENAVFLVGNVANATKGSLPLAVAHVGRAVTKQNVSVIGVATSFANLSTITPTIPQVPPSATLVNTTGGAIAFRVESPGDTGGIPIDSFTVFVDGNEPSEDDVMIQLITTSFLTKTLIMRVTNLNPETTIEITAVAVNSISLCDFSKKQTSQPVQFVTTTISQPEPPQITLQYVTGGGMKFSLVDPFDKGGAATTRYSVFVATSVSSSDWRRAASALRGPDDTKRPATVVAGLKPQTKYFFRVSASNGVFESKNSSVTSFSTSNISPPGACEEPALVAATGGMLTVAWEDPLDNGGTPVTDFTVTIQVAHPPGPLSRRSSKSRNYTFYGLSDETEYLISVRPRNEKGPGPDGPAATFSTTAATLPVGQIEVKTVGSTGGAALLAFNEPLDMGGTAREDMEYRVFVDNDNTLNLTYSDLQSSTAASPSSSGGRRLAASSPTGVIVGGLDPLSLYNIQIQPVNGLGSGNVSGAAPAATTQATLPSAPRELVVPVTAVQAGSLVLWWTVPADTGGLPLLDYVVYVGTNEAGPFSETCRDTITQCRVTKLDAATTYWFYVVASNTLGASPPSTTVSPTTLSLSRPSIPGKIQITSVSDNTIVCEWTAPLDDGGSAITGYSITVNDDTNSVSLPSVSSTTTTATISSLSPGTQYSLSVVAINQLSSSDSSVSRIVTIAIAANTPTDPIVSCVSKASVSLSWYPHPSATQYRLLRDGNNVYTGTTTNFVDTTVNSNAVYGYTVEAMINGNWAGATTSSVSASALDATSAEGSCPTRQGIVSEKNYKPNASTAWLLSPTDTFTTLTLEFTLFDLECDHDYVRVENADDATVLWQGGCTRTGKFIIQSPSAVRVHLTADASVEKSGFQLYYETDRFPADEVPTRIPPPESANGGLCSNRGVRQSDGTCKCSVGFTGEGCTNHIVCCSDPARCFHDVCSLDPSHVIVVSNEFGDDSVGTGAMMGASEHGTAAKAVKTLSKGINLAHDGDTIVVYPGIYKGVLNRELQVASKQNLRIESLKGYAWTTLDGENTGRAFQIATSSVVMDGFTIQNGLSSLEGGAITMSDSSLTMRNMLVTSNTATGNGGAIAAKKSTLAMVGVGIEKGTALEGGGVSLVDSELLMTQSNITNCKATDGGAALLSGSSSLRGDVDAVLSTNTATGDGGAVTIASGTASLKNLVISDNTAGRGGGVTAWDGGTITIDSCQVHRNKATSNGGGLALVGSVVLHGNKTDVVDNTAVSSGGGMFVQGTQVSVTFDTVVTSRFKHNQAVHGAGVAITSSHLALSGITIESGMASETGGGLGLTDSVIELKDVMVNSNVASTLGGGLHVVGSKIKTTRAAVVDNNQATINGGGLYLRDSSVTGSLVVSRNQATQNGGGFYGEGTVSLLSTVIQSCTADSGGGGFLNGASATAEHVQVADCTATTAGGGLALTASTLNVLTSEIHGCSAVTGGSIYVHGVSEISGDLVVSASSASDKGGALYATDKLHLSHVVLHDTTAAHGGGVFVELADVTATNVTLRLCTSSHDGGGWSAESSTLALKDVHLMDHKSGTKGGGFALLHTDVYHDSVTVSGSVAATQGGGISMVNSTFTPNPPNPTATSLISKNVAQGYGGNVYIEGTGTVQAALLQDGSAGMSGGGLAITRATVTVRDCTVQYNSANQQGGGLHLSDGSTCDIIDSTVSDNTALVTGGAVSVSRSVLHHQSVSFERNTAPRGGAFAMDGASTARPLASDAKSVVNASHASGSPPSVIGDGSAVYVAPQSVVEMIGFHFDGGVADRGGVFVDAATLYFEGCSFMDNTAAEGAAVYANAKSTVEMVGCNFSNNSASLLGGVAVFTGVNAGRTIVQMTDCVLTSNTAYQTGGAIAMSFADVTMTNLHMETNTVSSDDGGGGAIAVITTSKLNVTDCTFVNNTVLSDKSSGGTFYLLKATAARLERTSILSDADAATVPRDGGAIYISDKTSSLSLVNCDIAFSKSYAGGAIYASYATLVLLDTTLRQGHALEFGGAVYVDSGSLDVKNCTMSDNQAFYDGGAIYIKGATTVSVDTTVIEGNYVQDGGGGMYVAPGGGAVVDVTSSSFVENTNRGLGSAIFVGRKNHLTISFTDLLGNGGPATEGGTLYAVDAKVVIDQSTFSGNSATRGGAIELSRDATLVMTATDVVDNQATIWGGAFYMSVRAIATIQNSTLQGNNATTGGALYVLGSSKLTVRDSTFDMNRALSFGGAITILGRASADVSTSTFVSNAAYTGGVAAVTQNASLVVTSTLLSDNVATDFGGALYVDTLTRTDDRAIQLQGLNTQSNVALAGVDIYWVFHAWYVLSCDSCQSSTSASGKLEIATSPVDITAGWWPSTVTSGVSLGITKRNWTDPSTVILNPTSNGSLAGPGSNGGGGGTSGSLPVPQVPGRRRLGASSSSSSSSGMDAATLDGIAANPDETSPFFSVLWPTLVVRDYYGAIADQDNRTQCLARKLATERDKFNFFPPSPVDIARGYVTFEDAQVLADSRPEPFQLFINCTLADDVEHNLSITIKVDDCNPGYENADGRCIPCKKSMYSLDGVKCHACPLGATCEALDETKTPIGVSIPARAEGYFLHDSRETYLGDKCLKPSSWDDNDPCKHVEGNPNMTYRLQRCSQNDSFSDFWPPRRVFACLSSLEYYECDTRSACAEESTSEAHMAKTVYELTQRTQCEFGYGSVTCATCQNGFYKVSNGTCNPCSDPNDPNVAKMTQLMAMIPIGFGVIALLLVWLYFSNSVENEIMKQARAARKFQVYDPHARPQSLLLATRFFLQQRVTDLMTRARRTLVWRRNRKPHLFRIVPRTAGIPPFRAEKFKIMLGFFQIFGGFKKLYEIPWPSEMSRLMDLFSIADFSLVDTTGVECFIQKDYFSNYRLSVIAILVLLFLVTLLLSWGVVRYRVKLAGLPRHCVKCGLPVFQMLRREPKTVVRRATMVSMQRIVQKERALRMRRRSMITRAKDTVMNKVDDALARGKRWWNTTRAGQLLERFFVFIRLPASSSKHSPACPTAQRIESEVLAMVVRSNLRLWRSRVRLRLNYQSFQNKCTKLFFWILLLFYPELSQRVIGMFYCDEIGSQHYMSRDKSRLCYEGEWLYYLPLTMFLIAVWVAGVPLLFWIIIFLKRRSGVDDKMLLLEDPSNGQLKQRLLMEMRADLVDRGIYLEPEKLKNFEKDLMIEFLRNKKLSEPSMIAQVGFIYHSYRTEFWWFEVWDLGRKLFLNCIVGLLAKTGANRIIAGLIVFLIYLSVMLFYQPFKEQSDSTLAGVTQIQLFITLFCGLLLKMGALHMQDNVIMLLTYTAFVSNVLTITFAVLSIVYEKFDGARKARRRAREEYRRAIQTHVRKLWFKAYGSALTEIYLRDASIRPMPFRVILELARRDREEKKLLEMDLQLRRSLHPDEGENLSASQIELDLPRPGMVDTASRSESASYGRNPNQEQTDHAAQENNHEIDPLGGSESSPDPKATQDAEAPKEQLTEEVGGDEAVDDGNQDHNE